jgi:PAS domain S-box-containing protein
VRRRETPRREGLIDLIPQIVWSAPPDGLLDEYSQRWFEYTGLTPEEALTQGWSPALHPDDQASCLARWAESVATGEDYEHVFRLRRVDGEFRWHLGRALASRDARGQITRWFGTCTEIHHHHLEQEKLRAAQLELERAVRERIEQLSEANAALLRESAERRHTEERFRAAVDGMPDDFLIVECVTGEGGEIVDYRIVEINDAGASALRRPREELIGRLKSEVTDPVTHAALVASQNSIVAGQRAVERELRVERPGEAPRWVRQQLIPFRKGVVITARDITREKAADDAIKRSLEEKEVLLQEIHHRVKNNLQVVSSLLKLHGDKITEPVARTAFQDSQDRVRSIALLHEKLYQSRDLGKLNFAEYADSLVQTLMRTHSLGALRTLVEPSAVCLPIDSALPCGLILNELVTNAIKHAFRGGSTPDPRITIRVAEQGEDLTLTVQDNGCGLPEGVSYKESRTLGLHLVRTLIRQLRGEVRVAVERGTRWSVVFPRQPSKES